MKIVKIISIFLVLGAYSGLMTSCGHSHDGEHSHEHQEHSHEDGDHSHTHDEGSDSHDHDHSADAAHGEGVAFTSAYVCPMHCEGSGSDQEGKCPVCKMNYVAQADHTKDGHSH